MSLRALLLIASVSLAAGCSDGQSRGTTPEAAPFSGSAPTLDELGRRALRGLAWGDTASLEQLRLTEFEHNEVVWPELPASNPAANYPVELAWENIQLRNARDRSRALGWFRQRSVELERVECRGGSESFDSFIVQTDCYVVFTDAELGLLEVQVFKDVLVRNGGYKIFRYYDEAPEPSDGNQT